MTFNEYQDASATTDVIKEKVGPKLDEHMFLYYVMGLAGESGEVANKVKKLYRDGAGFATAEQKKELTSELGDVLWYITRLADAWGYTIEEVAEMNVAKLQSRKDRQAIYGAGDNR